MSETNDDTLIVRIKRSQFIALTIPLAFILGVLLGFFIWGSAENPIAQSALVSPSESPTVQQEVEPTGVEEVAETQTVSEQIESLERYDVPVDETDPVFGPPNAPITLIEFSDFECPFCQRHFEQVYPRLLADYPDQIRFVYKDFPLTSIHANARPAALAAQCALVQDAFWPFHDLLFSGELGLSRSSYEEYASRLELDMEEFAVCLDEEHYADTVQSDSDYAIQIGIRSTPTFFINGIGVIGAQPYEVFAQIIDYELEKANSSAD